MHDLSLKPGKKTSEFLALVATIVLQWTAMALTTLTDLIPVIPEEHKPTALLVVAVLTSLQAVVYNVKRGQLKKAAVEAVVGYNAVMVQASRVQADVGAPVAPGETDAVEPVAEADAGDIDLDAVDYDDLA